MSTVRKPATDPPSLRAPAPPAPAAPADSPPPGAVTPPPIPLAPDQRLLNRDLSWLEFNRRVLALAADRRNPLLTRVKFLAIFTSNLDEFFMKRVGFLRRQLTSGINLPTPDGLTPGQLLFAIRSIVADLHTEQARIYEEIVPALAEQGVHLVTYADLDAEQRRTLDAWYQANVFPVLTPLAVDPGHRFPFISNLSESLGVMVSQPDETERHFARVKIPDVLPRLVPIPAAADGPASGPAKPARFIPLDEVIRNNLDDLFPGMRIHEVMAFRVTRNAAIEIDENDHADMLASVENELRMRRFAHAVRLEVQPGAPKRALDFVVAALRLDPADVYERPGPLAYDDLFTIADLNRPDLREPRWAAVTPPRLAESEIQSDADIFAAIRRRDILLHHPYESFHASVERFIAAAARDPDVLAIKQTIYRTSRDSPFVASLIRAAEEGKQVAVLVELRARFDESKNVRFARQLEKAGVHVAYGVVGLKTHCKTSLVVRRETGPDGKAMLRSYAHLGTGNYNPSTAQLYTDLGLLTCDPGITEDLVGLFNFLTGRSLKREYGHLLVAPFGMREAYVQRIDREIASAKAGKPARIVAKMNALEDLKITEKLYEASNAGVKINLIVRGFCCLRPGVPGLSENIRVMCILGRFLEHSRIFHFAAGHEDPAKGEWFISSADWMYRNLSARVEASCPVKDPSARRRIERILEIMLADHRNAWDLSPDGTYTQRTPDPAADPNSPHSAGTFETLMREAGGEPQK